MAPFDGILPLFLYTVLFFSAGSKCSENHAIDTGVSPVCDAIDVIMGRPGCSGAGSQTGVDLRARNTSAMRATPIAPERQTTDQLFGDSTNDVARAVGPVQSTNQLFGDTSNDVEKPFATVSASLSATSASCAPVIGCIDNSRLILPSIPAGGTTDATAATCPPPQSPLLCASSCVGNAECLSYQIGSLCTGGYVLFRFFCIYAYVNHSLFRHIC